MRAMPKGYGQLETTKVGPRTWMLDKFWVTPHAIIPAGFVTDGASSPRWAWVVVDPASEFFEASIVHDYLYRYGIGTREEADKVWRKVALDFGANKFRTQLGYVALRVGGVNFGWNKAKL